MTELTDEEIIEKLEMIAADAKNDASEIDGKPFTGKTVATYFGYVFASIAALAKIMIILIRRNNEIKNR